MFSGLVQMRTRIMNQLHVVALNEGLRRKKALWRPAGRTELESLVLAPWASRRRQDLLGLLDQLTPKIQELTRTLEEVVEKRAVARRLRTHPGVGPLTALTFELVIGTPDRFYHNNHDGTFTDVAEKAGVAAGGWSTGPTWGDFDHDGFLDLFVPGYAKFDVDNPPGSPTSEVPSSSCQFRGVPVFCGPRGLPGEADHLFRNNGDGTFTDVSVRAGVSDPYAYYGFASVFVDADDDGWVDLFVANDSVPSYFYRNRRDGTFEDMSYMSGFALSGEGREQASMGIGVGDYNRDGKIDFFISTFSDDHNTLFRNEGDADFSDVSFQAGLGEASVPFLAWGNGFLDFDNDGLSDIFVANGHVFVNVDQQNWGTTWFQRPQLFRNLDGNKFQEVPPATGSGLADVIAARGAAFGDLFNDGHIDVVLNNLDSAPTLLRNVVKNSNHWITLKLIGGSKSPRDAIGAKIFLTAGGNRQRADVFSGGSYASSSDQRVHFGLGSATSIDKLEIHWPSGTNEVIASPAMDRIATVVEGKGISGEN